MSLDHLPEELLLIILRKLDFKSIHNLYDTGNCFIQTVIHTKGVIKECDLSQSSMATPHLLQTKFFKNLSSHLQELNLKGIQNLTKTSLLSTVKRIKNLVTLNIAYTDIHIIDFLDIYEQCSTIKNIAIDFRFYKTGVKNTEIPLQMILKCKTIFANFENVQFVGCADNLLHSSMPLNLLCGCRHLKTLTFVIAKNSKMLIPCYQDVVSEPIACKNFNIYNLCWRGSKRCNENYRPRIHYHTTIKDLHLDYEYVYICSDDLLSVYVECSSVFKSFFKDIFHVEPVVNPNPSRCVDLNSVIMFWGKQTTNFDNTFFNKLHTKLKPLFPCVIITCCDDREAKANQITNDWVLIRTNNASVPQMHKEETSEPLIKKRRIAFPNLVLDYDHLLRDKEKVELSIEFKHDIQHPVTLSSNLNYLKKLTFLQLYGSVRYSSEFFNVLFRCCENLVTLDVEASTVSPCTAAMSRSIPLSSTLKNLRITDRAIDFNVVFSSFAQCKTLENVIMTDLSNVNNDLGKPDTLFKQCKNLYYFCIEATMSDNARSNMLKLFNKVKLSCERWYLHIEINNNHKYKYTYDPFVGVFRLSRLKML